MKSTRGVVERYLLLGLSIGQHIEGYVDAYYGPERLRKEAADRSMVPPEELLLSARRLLSAIDEGQELENSSTREDIESPTADSMRRRWIRAQVLGLHTTCRQLCGERIAYADEVELCYGVRPKRVPEDLIQAAHNVLSETVPGSGSLVERLSAWRESIAIPIEFLGKVVHSIADDFRDRTKHLFGLPQDETVDFIFVENKPWNGFNRYLVGWSERALVGRGNCVF